MKDFVSRHRTSVVGAAAATSLLLALLAPDHSTLLFAVLVAVSQASWLRSVGGRVPLAATAPLRLKEEGTP